ncbi:uncharacterized protein THITE_160321 [Thermothielavioides terrestris NRRL 8126]|uniref:Uncharacterized protein n=1 Tax=Thermothielavioides terrestris (strain ATCC 38088 / NRRL 8126) TaxID=578455 RepID=G2R7W5_THETT|nr:uncharacterized protein THITE_160321 [Thermothielavioides terrestris NRRL 8126]AEO68024.1 hypothetical protein THITE_160321 [Thermothielavioides terrestris NRRL 8126]
MAMPLQQGSEAGVQGAQEAGNWTLVQVVVVTVLALVAFGSLVGHIFEWIRSRRIAKEMAAKLDNTVAELGVQQDRAESLEKALGRREAFIQRNVLSGPEAYSAASPECCQCTQCTQASPHEGDNNEFFAIGSEDEDDNSDGQSEAGESNAKSEESWPRVVGDDQAEAPLPVELEEDASRVYHEHSDSSPRESLRAQLDRYWQKNSLEAHPEDVLKQAEGGELTEVEIAVAEAGHGGKQNGD